jgi:hypothetical protein
VGIDVESVHRNVIRLSLDFSNWILVVSLEVDVVLVVFGDVAGLNGCRCAIGVVLVTTL